MINLIKEPEMYTLTSSELYSNQKNHITTHPPKRRNIIRYTVLRVNERDNRVLYDRRKNTHKTQDPKDDTTSHFSHPVTFEETLSEGLTNRRFFFVLDLETCRGPETDTL